MHVVPVNIPAISRARLEALARADRVSTASKLAELIDLACAAVDLPAASSTVRLQAYGQSCAVDLFDGAYRIALTRDGIKALAADLFAVADHGGSVANRENDYVVRRNRQNVVLEIDALARSPGRFGSRRTALVKALPPDVAREVAADLLTALT